MAYSNISTEAVSVDRVRRQIRNSRYPIRDGEVAFELNYMAQLAPWWTLQPDLQIPDPDDPDRTIADSILIGLRTVAF